MGIINEIIKGIFTGNNIAIIAAALAVVLPGLGSAKAVNMVARATAGLISEEPNKYGKSMLLQALPMTQGVYGLVAAFLIIFRIGLFTTPMDLTVAQGGYFLLAALPYALVGLFSAMKQGRVAASGINLLAKRPDQLGKAITNAALVETYAIFALLVTLLLVFRAPF